MSLDIQKCRQCGATSDGPFCNAHCEQDYISEKDAKESHELRERHERKLQAAANTHRAMRSARKSQLANILGPK